MMLMLCRRVMILLEVTVIASGGEVQGRIGAPQPLRATNADSSGPSSNQMQASAAPQNDTSTGVYQTCVWAEITCPGPLIESILKHGLVSGPCGLISGPRGQSTGLVCDSVAAVCVVLCCTYSITCCASVVNVLKAKNRN